MTFEKAVKEFLSFLSFPSYETRKLNALSLVTIIKLYLLVFLFSMVLFAPISMLLGIEDMPHAMEGIMESTAMWQVFLLAVILAPILEEFIFRFHMIYPSLAVVFIFIVGLVMVYFVMAYFNVLSFDFLDVGMSTSAKAVAGISLLCLLFVYKLLNQRSGKTSEGSLLARYFHVVFYVTAFVFAFVHVFNFSLEAENWYLTPLLVLPQFILALYLGYIRMRNDIYHCIFVHGLNNAIPMCILIIGQQFGHIG